MINFRFHLVSLTAIFLALAVGIIFGASVVNSGAVDGLRSQLGSVKADVGRVDQQNESLRRDLSAWTTFANKAAPGILTGRLQGVPVLVFGVRGIDAARIADLRADLVSADARLQGTVWLTSKFQLDRAEDVRALAEMFDLGTTNADVVREAVLARLANELVGGGGRVPPTALPTSTTTTVPGVTPVPGATTLLAPTTTMAAAPAGGVLAALAQSKYVDIDNPDTGRFDSSLPISAGTRFIVASGDGADLPDRLGAIALVRALASASTQDTRVVAVEPGRPAQGRDPEIRARFIQPLRSENKDLDARISTVNNVEDFRGRVAVVLALVDLGVGLVGHYGIGQGAERLVPESG